MELPIPSDSYTQPAVPEKSNDHWYLKLVAGQQAVLNNQVVTVVAWIDSNTVAVEFNGSEIQVSPTTLHHFGDGIHDADASIPDPDLDLEDDGPANSRVLGSDFAADDL